MSGDCAPSDQRPSPAHLWRQSCHELTEGSDEQVDRYRELMLEHGHLRPRQPGDDPNLPCGWPHREEFE